MNDQPEPRPSCKDCRSSKLFFAGLCLLCYRNWRREKKGAQT